jgi:hypothetical protein
MELEQIVNNPWVLLLGLLAAVVTLVKFAVEDVSRLLRVLFDAAQNLASLTIGLFKKITKVGNIRFSYLMGGGAASLKKMHRGTADSDSAVLCPPSGHTWSGRRFAGETQKWAPPS